MRGQIIKVASYIGTGCFLVMPYVLDHNYGLFLAMAFLGNILILPQVWEGKQYNLVGLNITGAVGYFINIINLIFF